MLVYLYVSLWFVLSGKKVRYLNFCIFYRYAELYLFKFSVPGKVFWGCNFFYISYVYERKYSFSVLKNLITLHQRNNKQKTHREAKLHEFLDTIIINPLNASENFLLSLFSYWAHFASCHQSVCYICQSLSTCSKVMKKTL